MTRNTRAKFIKVAGLLWGSAILLMILIALLAPHVGRIADIVLHQTTYRDWEHLVLTSERKFFDSSTPFNTIKSYYSALYLGDADAMQRLTTGAFQHQIRARMREAQLPDSTMTYRSYLHAATFTPQQAVVAERFHLFWRQGLVFHLRRRDGVWRIGQVQLAR
jgi:hypothetical protein